MPAIQTPLVSTNTGCTKPPYVPSEIVNESLVAIMSSILMERMSASYDLPHVQVQTFDGSTPDSYPAFRQRFRQMVVTRPLNDSVKMTRLLQLLEGPALIAVQRYESMSGDLTKALIIWEVQY